MSKATLVHYRSGSAIQCSNDCVCQNGTWLLPCTDTMCDIPMSYLKGNKPPNYPLPAIKLFPIITPFIVDSPYYASIIIWEARIRCEGCGTLHPRIVALWDFDFDRSCDFFLPYGEYVNLRMFNEGVAAHEELQASGTDVQ